MLFYSRRILKRGVFDFFLSMNQSSSLSTTTSSSTTTTFQLPRFDSSTLSASSLESAIDHAFLSAKSIPNKLIELGSEEDLVLTDGGVNFLLSVMSTAGYTKKNEISPANLISNDKGSTKRSWPPQDAFESLDDGSLAEGKIVTAGEEANLKLNDQAVVCEISTTPSSQTSRLLFAIALNKFPARAKHLLIISRRWAPQSSPLDRGSFEVLWACVSLLKGVAFFNGGFRSGASQPRRHCQFIPFVSLKEVARLYGGIHKDEESANGSNKNEKITLPVHNLVLSKEALLNPKRGSSFTISQFNFKHRFAIVRGMSHSEVFETYKKILSELDLPAPDEFINAEEEDKSFQALLNDPLRGLPKSAVEDASSHNVVVTEEFMFVVPRVTDGARDGDDIVGVNALLFTGLALIKPDGVQVVKRLGCFEVMKRVSFSI
jgi:ATP adenylyltransferase/5',5'''-P-1,P-4-tetraphosphate phosphorylase II